MKIALINGSPKTKGSASESILRALKPLLPDEHETIEYHLKSYVVNDHDLELMAECNALVFAFPLYVDGIPSHLVSCLYQMETFFSKQSTKKTVVYALVNSGFYEGRQNAVALELMENWCEKAQLTWGQGIGIGGGGMLTLLSGVPDGQGPKKNLWETLMTITSHIPIGASADNIFISPNFPRFAYKIAAEMGWRQQGKANGLTKKDLFTQK